MGKKRCVSRSLIKMLISSEQGEVQEHASAW